LPLSPASGTPLARPVELKCANARTWWPPTAFDVLKIDVKVGRTVLDVHEPLFDAVTALVHTDESL
jgi:hypothetical protein